MRLMYIADHCPSLKIDALKMAISAVQETYNVALYQQLHRKLQEATVGYDNLSTSFISIEMINFWF